MSLTIALRKKRFGPAFLFTGGVLHPTSAITTTKLNTPPDVIASTSGGTLNPTGSVATEVSGPSLVTVEMLLAGVLGPAGSVATLAIPTPLDTYTALVGGTLSPVGSLSSNIDPATVTIAKTNTGFLVPTGTVVGIITASTTTVTKSIAGTLTPAGVASNVAGGPSFVTITKNVGGTLTPAAAIGNVVVPPPVTFFSQDLSATLSPTGSVARVVSGPSIVTIPKLITASLAPSSNLTKQVSGPSFVTIPNATSGTLSMSGGLTRLVSGPSLITVPKSIAGTLTPAGALSSGSFTTVTKSLAGTLTPAGSVARSVGGGPGTTVPKSVGGQLSPIGSLTVLKNIGNISSAPMYVAMGNWDIAEFDLAPQWPSILFTGILASDSVSRWTNIFAAMRARGMKGGPAIINKASYCDGSGATGFTPNFTKYKALVDKIAAVPNIASYIAGGECGVICAADEPYHPDFVPGSFPTSLQKQFAQYCKTALPGIKTWYRQPYQLMSGASLPAGGWAGSVDMCEAQYGGPLHNAGGAGATGLTALQTYQQQLAGAKAAGIPMLMCGFNWQNGGDGSSGIAGPQSCLNGATNIWVATPQEIKGCIDAALTALQNEPGPQWFMLWTDTHNSNLTCNDIVAPLQDNPSYMSAWNYAKSAGLARGGTPSSPTYYTDTAQHAAPYPPVSIPLGGAVRDSLTDHKVFHLLDNARLQDAEYPALNSDNSRIYFVRGGAGQIGDVTLNILTSSVQVGNIRSAFDASFPGVVDGVIWDRNDRRYLYYLSGQAPLRLLRKDTTATQTSSIKDISTDPRFTQTWGASASSLLGSGLHSSRSQERFVLIVGTGAGLFAWDRLSLNSWSWRVPTGKIVARVTIDDLGQYVKVHYTNASWIILQLDVNGQIIELGSTSGTQYGPQSVAVPAGTVNITAGTNIQGVVNANPAGTKYFLRAGVHRLQSIVPKTADEYYGEPGTILNGSRVLTTFGTSGSLFTATGQTQQGALGGGVCDASSPGCDLPELLFFDNVLKVRQTSLAAVNGPGKWYFDYAADTIYMFDNPSSHVVEIGVTRQAFGGGANNVVIRGITVEKYANDINVSAIHGPGTSGWIVEDCEVRFCHGAGVSATTNAQIRRCYIHHNGWLGIVGATATGPMIENCEISFNNTVGYSAPWGAGGIKLVNQVNNTTIRNNYVHHNNGFGVWHDNCDGPALYDGNYVTDHPQAGIYHEVSGSATIQNNISGRNRVGIMVDNSDHVTIQNNTVGDNTDGGITLRQVSRPDLPARDLNNALVTNNDIGAQHIGGGSGCGLVQFVSNNVYFTVTKNNRFTLNRYKFPSTTSAFLSWNNSNMTFAQWQAAGNDLAGSITASGGGIPPLPSQSTALTSNDPPQRDDCQTNKLWQSSGRGVKRWAMNPPTTDGTIVYDHPQRNSKPNSYAKGKVSLQAVDEVVYESLFYSATLTATWVVHSGEIFKLNWATELAASPNKGAPEVVRQGLSQLTPVSSLANLTARGQWFYDSATQTLYARCTDGLSPSTKRMVVFDWRFGMEEIVMVNTNGTLKGRLCRHNCFVSDPLVDVDAFRGASVSYDGSIVTFGSNWGGQSSMGVYAALTDPRL